MSSFLGAPDPRTQSSRKAILFPWRRVADENRAKDMDRVLRQNQVIVEINIRIREVDRQRRIVIANVRSEQQRLHAVEQQFKLGDVSRVAVKQPIGPAGGGADIAVAVDHK